MAEEKKSNGADDPINLLLEQALTRQRDEMMENFSHILQCLPIATGASSSSDQSLTQTPLLLLQPQQFNQKNQQILKRGSAFFIHRCG
jgi:hypothetical protein